MLQNDSNIKINDLIQIKLAEMTILSKWITKKMKTENSSGIRKLRLHSKFYSEALRHTYNFLSLRFQIVTFSSYSSFLCIPYNNIFDNQPLSKCVTSRCRNTFNCKAQQKITEIIMIIKEMQIVMILSIFCATFEDSNRSQ